MSKDWTDKLPSLLEDYEESAPEGLWDAVRTGVSAKKRRGTYQMGITGIWLRYTLQNYSYLREERIHHSYR